MTVRDSLAWIIGYGLIAQDEARQERRRPQPHRSFARVPRRQFDAHVAAVEKQRDAAIGRARALRDWITAWLEQRAAGYDEDARWLERLKAAPDRGGLTGQQRRAIAHELRQAAIDFERGPE